MPDAVPSRAGCVRGELGGRKRLPHFCRPQVIGVLSGDFGRCRFDALPVGNRLRADISD